MVADNNKNPASNKDNQTALTNQQILSNESKLGRGGGKRFVVAAIVILLVIAGAGFIGSKIHIGQKVYAQAAGHKIYKKDVERLTKNTEGVSQRQAATVLADKYLVEAMAKEQGISVTVQDVKDAYGASIEQESNKNPYSYQLQVNQLYFDKLQEYNQGVYKGNLLVAQFSRNIILSPTTTPNLNNSALIADKAYAKNFITNLYNQVKAGELSWDQAANIERQDPKLGESVYPTLSHSGPFDTSVNPVALFTPASAREQLRKLKPGEISQPFAVSVMNSVNINDKQPFESYYLVVEVSSSAGGKAKTDFQQELTAAKKQFGYKVNV